ncbi:MAG TPA: glycosyltransferase family 1 protein [Lachnospiraceae bacterium]|nr:glycosyltransferase family 1 protein [Lachnospiraceae bacterium]
MRIVLFYSEVESFNFFADQLAMQFRARGHEVFIFDLVALISQDEALYMPFIEFVSRKVDIVVCFDGLGMREDMFIEAWDSYNTIAVDILMDPPFRFHPTLEKHPRNYLLFCCDYNHVEYVKEYFGQSVPRVAFMPHVGVRPPEDGEVIPWEKRSYDILFSGTYYRPEERFSQLEKLFPRGSDMYRFYECLLGNLVENSAMSVEQAVPYTLAQAGVSFSPDTLRTVFRCSEDVDWAIRMYRRGQVIQVLADAGLELHLLGRGWENHPSAGLPNVHRVADRIPYGQTLRYMADARVNLNVMPGFKAGTHDRIFNTLLQHSLPLTDSSTWIDEHFTDGEDIALYDLAALGRLPEIAEGLLMDPSGSEEMIRKGYEKVVDAYTWSDCAGWILQAVDNYF